MKRSVFRKKIIVWPVILLAWLIGIAPRSQVWAMPTASASAAVQQAWTQRQQDEANIRQFLSDQTVRQKLSALSLPPAEVEMRLSQLNDQEVRELAAQIDHARSGGWVGGVLVGLGVLAFLAFIAWLIFDYVEHHPAHEAH